VEKEKNYAKSLLQIHLQCANYKIFQDLSCGIFLKMPFLSRSSGYFCD